MIFERAIDLLIEQVKKERFATGRKARPAPAENADESSSRHIPDAIKREVFERDGGRCTFTDAHGRRCGETGALEFDHRDGFAGTRRFRGAPAVRTTNTPRIRCTGARSWNERAHRSIGLQPRPGFRQGECRMIRADWMKWLAPPRTS